MSCCGQKRLAQVAQGTIRFERPSEEQAPMPASISGSALRYLGDDELVLRGPRTGNVYRFTQHSPVITVAPADFDAFLKTRLFRHEPAA